MSVAQEIENIVLNNFVLSEVIAQDIVNYRKLAKRLISDYNIKATVENVAIALQRLRDKINSNKRISINQDLYEVNVRNNIVNLTIKKNDTTKRRIYRVQAEDLFFTYIESRKFYEIISNIIHFERMKKIFEDSILFIEDNLSLITIRFSDRLLKTPGVLALILRNLAFYSININLLYTTHKEINILIKERDASKAYQIISSLRESLKFNTMINHKN